MEHGLARRESVDTEMHKSEEKRKSFVLTKKRGYDVTRNPHLNKVWWHDCATLAWSVCKFGDAFEDCRNFDRRHGTVCLNEGVVVFAPCFAADIILFAHIITC